MKRYVTGMVFFVPLVLSAETGAAGYQDGILTKVRTIVVSNACSHSTESDAAAYGNTARGNVAGSASCYDIKGAVYTVRVGDAEYELSPDRSVVARATAFLPGSAAFVKRSSLANHLPGTPVKLRTDAHGIFVLVDQRETRYSVFDAH